MLNTIRLIQSLKRYQFVLGYVYSVTRIARSRSEPQSPVGGGRVQVCTRGVSNNRNMQLHGASESKNRWRVAAAQVTRALPVKFSPLLYVKGNMCTV